MGRPGFEPGTNRLKAEYSTVELATQINKLECVDTIRIPINNEIEGHKTMKKKL